MSTQARKANVGLDLAGKTAVVVGGSQGIGAAVAIRFAQAGANVVVIGRNKKRLEKVISDARAAAKSAADQKFDYISADLSLVSSTKTAAEEIVTKTNGHVDYLFQSQGGMPNGLHEPTSEGIESHFAVQVLGRFQLNYILASTGVLKDTSISIMAPGGQQTEFNLDGMDLVNDKDSGRFALMGKQMTRDGVIVDTYTKALQSKFPSIKFLHISPGLVQTDVTMNQGVPTPLRQLITYVVFPIAARTFGNTPTSYADIPVFLAGNKGREEVIENEGLFLDVKNKRVDPSPYALDEKNQQEVFERLMKYLKAVDE